MSEFFVKENYTSDNATRAFEHNYRALSALLPASVQFVLCSIAMTAIIRVPTLRQGQSLFMVNLVLSDILRTVVGVWSFQKFFFRVNAITDGDVVSCKIFLFLWYFQFFWSMWGTVLIVYGRYSTVYRPLETNITTHKAAIAICCTCATGVIVALFPVFGWAQYDIRYQFQSYTCLLAENKENQAMSFSIFYFGLTFAIPLVLVTVFLTQTLRKVIRSARIRQRMTYNSQPDRVGVEASSGEQSMVKSKAFWYVISVVTSNVILPAPYVAVQLIGRSTTISVGGRVYASTAVVFSLNFVVNALLYVFWVKTFTRSLADVLCCRRLRQR